MINGLSASLAPIGTATHSPGRACVGRFARRRRFKLTHHLEEPFAGLRPRELVGVGVGVVLEPRLQVVVVEDRVDRLGELVGIAELDQDAAFVGRASAACRYGVETTALPAPSA